MGVSYLGTSPLARAAFRAPNTAHVPSFLASSSLRSPRPSLAITTYHVGGALLGLMMAAILVRQVRDLRHQKRISNLEHALARTTRELAAANSENADFLANVSHDLRNPISGILGVTNALDETRLDAAQLKLTESIRSCAGVLSALIDDLLAASKLHGGHVDLSFGPFDLAACIEDVVAMFKSGTDFIHATVSIHLDPSLPRDLYSDRARVQQILLHFLTNAHKFGGGKRITVTAIPASDGRLRLCVRNEGCGSSRAGIMVDKIPDVHSERSLRGPGFGLASCRVLAQKMGGIAGVETPADEGSYFWMELPLREPESESAPAVAMSVLHNPTALVVEDIDYSAAATETILRSLGFRARSVSDGTTALQQLESSTYDLVLMDWNVPGLIGPEVTARFRASENPAHRTIIIATTAYSAERNRDLCLAAGMDAFIAKPLTPEKITTELKRLGKTVNAPARVPVETITRGTFPAHLDLQILQFLSDGTDEGLAAQVARFTASFAADLTSARSILRQGDRREIARIAHRLLSHALAIKCTPIIELSGKLQQHRDELVASERDQLLTAIEREFAVLKGTLESLPVSTRLG